MSQWEQESKNSNTNQVKRINDIEEKVGETWSSYQELTVRLDKLTLTLNLNKGKMAAFSAASIVLGKSYFGANNDDNFEI